MFWLLKILIGRSAVSLDRVFSYAAPAEAQPQALTRVLVDFGHSHDIVGFIAAPPEKIAGTPEEYKDRTGIRLSYIKRILDPEPLLTPQLAALAQRLATHYYCPLIAVYQAMLPPSLKPKDSSLGKPRAKNIVKVRAREGDESQLTALEKKALAKIKAAPDGLRLTAAFAHTVSYKSLLAKGLVAAYSARVDRIKDIEPLVVNATLTAAQQKALAELRQDAHLAVLFEGVTGSGKTMVYLELAKELLAAGRGSIILVPEIALTNRAAALFKGVFGPRVSILHSALPAAAKYDEFRRLSEGQSQVVVGTRSAIFAPVKNLGLIVIDEEQSSSYKQDTTPFYDARTVAMMRAALEKAKVILASATPLIEDRARAAKGVFGKVTLDRKFAATPNVTATFADMSDLANITAESTILSKPLLQALTATFAAREQAILFINRRGFAPIVQCRSCRKTLVCPNCGIPLTYHRREGIVTCHRCDTRLPFGGLSCPHCHGREFYELGYGTERIAAALAKFFPAVKVARLDRDTSASEKERSAILDGFYQGQYDCLIGTEMIAKGHDFPRVTLAAALAADQSLALPGYLAAENTFDLVAQLVGRSGRAKRPGRAIIQTYDPLNKVLLYAARQDYEGFYAYEMANRKNFLYPPYCYLCDLTVSGLDIKKVLDTAYALKTYLIAKLEGRRANIYGPADPVAALVNRRHFKKIMVKYKNPAEVREALAGIHDVFAPAIGKGIEITIDVDPRGD